MPARSSAAQQLAVEYVGDSKTSKLLLAGGRARLDAAGSGGAAAAGVGSALRAAFRHAFLPDGYPASVSSDYLSELCGWRSLKWACSACCLK